MEIETALNGCLPRYRIFIEFLGCSASFHAIILECPQCRGQGGTIAAALGMARRQYGRFRDAQAALNLRTLLSGESPCAVHRCDRARASDRPVLHPPSATPERNERIQTSLGAFRPPEISPAHRRTH